MKLLCIVIFIIVLLGLIKYNNQKNVMEGFSLSREEIFKQKFNTDYFYQNYKIAMRENNNFEYQIIPSTIKYIYMKKELLRKYPRKPSILARGLKPNIIFKLNIPNNLDKTCILYKIKNLDVNDIIYDNYLFYKYFKLHQEIVENNTETSKLKYLYIFQNDIMNEYMQSYSNYKNYPLVYELPLRFEGDTRDESSDMFLRMFMLYFKYELTLDIYSIDSINISDIEQIKINYSQIGLSKDIEIKAENINEVGTVTKKINNIGYNIIFSLFPKVIEILTRVEDTVDVEKRNSNLLNYTIIPIYEQKEVFIYEYPGETYHGKKISQIVKSILFYFDYKIQECKNYKLNSEISEDDKNKLEKILDDYVTVPSSEFDTFSGQGGFLDTRPEYKSNQEQSKLVYDAQKQYLDFTKSVGDNLMKIFDSLSEDFKKEIIAIDISQKINDIKQNLDIKNATEDKDLTHYQVKLNIDLSDLAPEIPDFSAPSDLTEEEKEQQLLRKLTPKQKLLFYIKKDLRKVIRNRKGTFIDLESLTLSDELKSMILGFKNDLKNPEESIVAKTKEHLDFLKFIMDKINTGNIKIINTILDFKVTDNVKVLQSKLIECDKVVIINESPSPDTSEGFSNLDSLTGDNKTIAQKYIKTKNFRDNYKKNMNDIYKRYLEFKMKAEETKRKYDEDNNTIYESFENISLPQHQHTDTGTINFLRGSQQISRDDFEKIDWLRKPENQRLVATYNFLSDGQKKEIVQEIDKMEQELFNLKNYTQQNYGEVREKLNMIEAKAKEQVQKEQAEANMTDLEKQMRDFQEKEKEQEAIMKRMNEKISNLEKEQKGLNLSRFDKINSVRSYGDGQVLSVLNLKDNQYQIKANQGCITQNKDKLLVEKCGNKKQQKFNFHHINNHDEYNHHLGKKVDEYTELSYPFHIITPEKDKSKCVAVHGNKMSLVDCQDSKFHRFETLQSMKKCDSFYGN